MRLIWTEKAAADALLIYEYIAEHSELYADSVYERILARPQQLLDHRIKGNKGVRSLCFDQRMPTFLISFSTKKTRSKCRGFLVQSSWFCLIERFRNLSSENWFSQIQPVSLCSRRLAWLL